MPMLPSASRTWPQVPSPGSGANTSRRTIGVRWRRHSRCATTEWSTPSAGTPRSASAATRRPGPAAEVDRRAGAAVQQPPVLAVRGAPPAPHGQVDLDAVVAHEPGRRPRERGVEERSVEERGVEERPTRLQHPRTPLATAVPPRVGTYWRANASFRQALGASAATPRRLCREPRPGRDPRDGRRVGGGVHVGELGQQSHPQAGGLQRVDGPLAGVVTRGRHVGDRGGGPRVAQAQRPPAAVRGRAEHRVDGAAVQRPGGVGEQGRVDLRGVHPELEHRAAGQQARRRRRARRRCGARGRGPAGHVVTPRRSATGNSVTTSGGGHRSHQRDDHPAAGHAAGRVERVQQRGRGEVGRLGGQRGAQPGLHPPGFGRLREDEQAQHGRGHRSSPAMSRAARSVPRTEPETFDRPPARAR